MRNLLDLIGRLCLSTIFIFEAYDTIGFATKTKETMTRFGLTWQQDWLLYGAIFLLVVGALTLLFGYRSTFGATLLLCYLVPVTFIVYDFWNAPKEEIRLQSILFMKNIAIIGGLLMVMANGSGRYSIRKLLATTRV